MKIGTARKWIGIYFLLTTVFVGCFLLFFNSSSILPITQEEANSSFQIIIPVLVGQITVIFQWFSLTTTQPGDIEKTSPIPGWLIKLPPLLVLFIIVLATVTLALANSPDSTLSVSPNTFKSAITFSVTLLNASTVFLVTKLFPSQDKQ